MRDEFVELEDLSTKELEQLMREELDRENQDSKKIREILQVLEAREADVQPEINGEVIAAWEKYKHTQNKKKQSLRWIKSAIATAAIVSVIVAVTIPRVFGKESLLKMVVSWTEDIFTFTGTQTENQALKNYVFKTDHPDLQEVYNTVVELGVEQPVVPMWIPDGYILRELKVSAYSDKTSIYACFEGNQGEIVFLFDFYAEQPENKYTKKGSSVRFYESESGRYYLIPDKSKYIATWVVEKVECSITADSEDLLVKMIESLV